MQNLAGALEGTHTPSDLLVVVDSDGGHLAVAVGGVLAGAGYRFEVFEEPAQAVQAVVDLRPFAVLVADTPGAGVGLIRLMKRYVPGTLGVLCSGNGASVSQDGADAVVPPVRLLEELGPTLARLTRGADTRHGEALSIARGLVRALAMRQVETVPHSERLAAWAKRLATALRLGDRVRDAELGGLLHDIGQLGVSDQILLKPGKLTPTEFAALRRHPLLGVEMISGAPLLKGAIDIVKHHHERWDGDGYPEKRKGRHIPVTARLFAVCDTYEAITQDRPHRPAATDEEARRRIQEASGAQFDPQVVEGFLSIPRTEWVELGRQVTERLARKR